MRDLLERSITRLQAGERVVWCVILSAEGSAPRGPGAKMAVFEDGTSFGTVGGGAVEYQTVEIARTLNDGKGIVRDFDLFSGGSEATGMVCGGHVQIGFLPLGPSDAEQLRFMLRLWEDKLPDCRGWLLKLAFLHEGCTIKLQRSDADLLHRESELFPRAPTVLEKDDGLLYVEPVRPKERVYIFGAGHVSQALVPVLLPLDFSITVVDPRPELTTSRRFPGASLLCAAFDPLPSSVSIKKQDYVVVMTPGHEKDLSVLRQVLRTPASYIGCIGSRKKTAYVNQKLLEEGYSETEISRIHAPIGLPILAKTPEEIAISIAAEMILHRAETK